eukprot:EG_transcript_7952
MDGLQALLSSGRIEKCSNADLKARLKELKLSGSGEKGTLIARLRYYIDGEKHKVDGVNPTQLSLPALRKAVAARGLSCIGTQDEMLHLLLAHLKDSPEEAGAGPAGAAARSGGGGGGPVQPQQLARRVLELEEAGNPEAILSLLGDPITRASSVGAMRKAYLKLSLLLHPDKLGAQFEGATRCFQAVVSAFETLSRPEAPSSKEGPRKPKGPMIARSNEGCHRTGIVCPRCRVDWGSNVEGNPDYYYNFMMMGLKAFTCATCLLQFGCMTAVHRCPFCRTPFEYHPDDYHRKLQCRRPACQREFGFFMFPVSERALQDLYAEVKAAQELRMRTEEARRRRAAAALRRNGSRTSEEEATHQERLFCLGLRDECPRCGAALETLPDEDAQRRHLLDCADGAKHAQHAARQAAAATKATEQARRQGLQDEVAAEAAWSLLGAQSQHLWLLSEEQLRRQCEQAGLPTTGDKDELIARLAAHRKDQKFLTAGEGGEVVPEVTPDTLPSNLYAMSEAQLRAVCAAHNIDPKPLRSKKALIGALEGARDVGFRPAPVVALLTQPEGARRLKGRPGKRCAA